MSSVNLNHYTDVLIEREKGEIKIGNSLIKSNLGIFNYPKGFGRKTFLSRFLSQNEMFDWNDDNKTKEFRFIENYYNNVSQIMREKIILCEKTQYTIIICDEKNISNWIDIFNFQNIPYVHYNKKKKFQINKEDSKIILVSPSLISYLVQNFFHRFCIKRLILFDPELMLQSLNYIPQLFYGFAWIISSEPLFLQSLDRKHFIYNYLPVNIDNRIFNSLIVCQEEDVKIQTLMKDEYKLPSYHLIKHTCKDEMYKILKGILDEELYNLLHHGMVKQVLEKLNAISNCNNIIDFIHEKIESEITETEKQLENYKNLKIRKDKDLEEYKQKLVFLKKKRETLHDKIREYTNNNECIICRESMKEPILLYCCQNIICFECIVSSLKIKNNCPYCRTIIHNDDIISLKYNLSLPEKKNSSKVKHKPLLTRYNKVFEIIGELRDKKEILFFYSDVNEILETLISFCLEKNIDFIELKEYDKKQVYEKIKKREVEVIILSNYRELIGYEFPMVNHFVSFPYLKKYVYKFICSRFYRLERKDDFYFHSFVTFS